MKIVCESCGAKYSIADERVTGKVFKIRCKRCSEVIVVRGDQPAPAAAAPTAAPEPVAQDGIWHVVVEGEQAGPYTPLQLGELLTAATIDWEAYVWTEGFDNWVPMRDVEDLVAQITGQAPAPAAQPARAAIPTSTLVGQPSMGADPFADDPAPSGGMFGDGGAGSGDLFGRAQAAASPFGGDDGVVASSPSPRVSSDKLMTGARNENSVLFSLKNLQALATGSSGTSMPPAAAMSSDSRSAGFASGEGSGLIDIRALASATGVSEAGAGGGAKDELLSLGSQGGAFGTLGSPMLAPVGGDDDGGKTKLIWAAVAIVGFLSMAAVGVAFVMRPPPAPPPAPVGIVAPVTAQAAAVPAPAAAPTAPTPSEGELEAAKQESAKGDGEHSGSGSGSRRRRSSSSGEGSPKGDGEPAGETRSAPAPEAPAKPGGPRTIDDLLDGALKGGSSRPTTKPDVAPASNLPDQPSRDQVISAMNSVKSQVASCGQGQGGVATVKVSVAGATGRVTNAQVSGVTGPGGSCVAKAVRGATFPKFQQKVFSVTFPFKL